MSTKMPKPELRPRQPSFSSGPCPKRPNWSLQALSRALVGRSHRSDIGKAKLRAAIDQTRDVLGIPVDYRIGIVAGSDTGAVEIALWNLLGARDVDVLAWESFGRDWVTDIVNALGIVGSRVLLADYGELPDLHEVNFNHDVVFVWNGTTSGVKVPDGDWIRDDRSGLTICDATSAAFAMELPWHKLDVVTFSWQKVLGGEGAHGMLVVSPRAVARLETYRPSWPLPKLFRLCKEGKLDEAIFDGRTINTPSMLCVEDYLDALEWARDVGGLKGLLRRSAANLRAITTWVEKTSWIDFLASREEIRSNTSICLKFTAPMVMSLSVGRQADFAKRIAFLLEHERVALDISSYRNAPPGIRIWGGATVELADIKALLPWIEWAYAVAIFELES
ncbi:MAG TPA: phosphoserine transaminase [Gammaproteobacteria bacterium]|nr:phosphoserine transaminase [Gammaproteobacteria bacterium]